MTVAEGGAAAISAPEADDDHSQLDHAQTLPQESWIVDLSSGNVKSRPDASKVMPLCLARVCVEIDRASTGLDLMRLRDTPCQTYGAERAREQCGILRYSLNKLFHACGPKWQLSSGETASDGSCTGNMRFSSSNAHCFLGHRAVVSDTRHEQPALEARTWVISNQISYAELSRQIGVPKKKDVWHAI